MYEDENHSLLYSTTYRFPYLGAVFKTTIGVRYKATCICGWWGVHKDPVELLNLVWSHEKTDLRNKRFWN